MGIFLICTLDWDSFRWVCAKKTQPHCVSNGVTSFLHWTIVCNKFLFTNLVVPYIQKYLMFHDNQSYIKQAIHRSVKPRLDTFCFTNCYGKIDYLSCKTFNQYRQNCNFWSSSQWTNLWRLIWLQHYLLSFSFQKTYCSSWFPGLMSYIKTISNMYFKCSGIHRITITLLL